MILLGMIFSAFFNSIRNCFVTGIIFILFFNLFLLNLDNIRKGSIKAGFWISLSPIGSISLLSTNILAFESIFQGFGFDDLYTYVNNYQGILFFIFGTCEFFLFLIWSLYFFLILPRDSKYSLNYLLIDFSREKSENQIFGEIRNSFPKNFQMYN